MSTFLHIQTQAKNKIRENSRAQKYALINPITNGTNG